MGDMTFHINLIVIGFAILAALLLLVSAALLVFQKLASRHIGSDDLEQIGKVAIVLKTIRPGRPGQIRYHAEDGDHQVFAESDSGIRNGNMVIIQSVAQNRFRVRALTSEELAAARQPDQKTDTQPAPDDGGQAQKTAEQLSDNDQAVQAMAREDQGS